MSWHWITLNIIQTLKHSFGCPVGSDSQLPCQLSFSGPEHDSDIFISLKLNEKAEENVLVVLRKLKKEEEMNTFLKSHQQNPAEGDFKLLTLSDPETALWVLN